MMVYFTDFLTHLWNLTLEASPWLAFGLLVAGMIRMWLPQHVLQRWLGGRGMGAVTRAAVIGTPLPLCSCSVLPAALALRRGGASRGATTSFLIATPENGVDSIALSYALLGPFMAVVRPVAALGCALFAGVLTEVSEKTHALDKAPKGQGLKGPRADGDDVETSDRHHLGLSVSSPTRSEATSCDLSKENSPAQPALQQAGCCEDQPVPCHVESSQAQNTTKDEDCCGSDDCCESNEPPSPTVLGRSVQTLRYGFIDFYGDILGWLVIGLLLAALVTTIFPPASISAWGSGILAMVGMLVIGVPMYICATASTPVAASLLLAGVSPGTVLVFLLAGPATNLASLGIVRRELGTPALTAYLLAIGLGAILAGLITDWLASLMSINVLAQTQQAAHIVPYWLALGSAILLLGLAAWLGLRWALNKFAPPQPRSQTLSQRPGTAPAA